MEVPWKIKYAVKRLAEGHRVNRITVRDFLQLFEVERRGAAKVEAIRDILDDLGLETSPDFESAWINEPIRLRLKGHAGLADASNEDEEPIEIAPSAAEQVVDAPTSAEPEVAPNNPDSEISDPTFRIGALSAANKPLVTVRQDDNVTKAITLMIQHDFSQLPVMQGDREVKGVITWKSITRQKILTMECETVGDCQEDARIIDSNRTLFDAIATIVEHGYVLVRRKDKTISGIVTASDLSLQFQTLAEPFLLLREIELHIRQILKDKIVVSDYDSLDNLPGSRPPKEISELTFGHYIRLFDNNAIWAKLNLRIDQQVLRSLLDEVRKVRNEVMHFDPDPMSDNQLSTLKSAVRLMQEVFPLVRL